MKPMRVLVRKTLMPAFGLLLLLLTAPVWSESEPPLSRLAVIALAPLDGQAVVRWPRGTMRIVRQGETIPGTEATVIQVLLDRLVVSQHTPMSGEELAWIYQAPVQGGFSRVMYLQHHASPSGRERVSTPIHRHLDTIDK